jgi:GNAT superfamily N-acetyltransferase
VKHRIVRIDPINNAVLADKIKAIHLECLPDDDVLEPDEGQWWGVYYGADLVGFCAMRISSRWGDTGYLWRSAVLKAHRGRGLQRRMIAVREKLARRFGWMYMISDTNDNPTSANNLIACGYKMYNPSWPYGADTTCYWVKKL